MQDRAYIKKIRDVNELRDRVTFLLIFVKYLTMTIL